MAGPRQAAIFCLGFGLLPIVGPWLSSAAIALVVLQVGFNQAIKVLPWAALPAIVWAAMGDLTYLILLSSVFVAAVVFESRRSLALGLLVAVTVSALGFLVMQKLAPESLEQLSKVMSDTLGKSPEMDKLVSGDGSTSAEVDQGQADFEAGPASQAVEKAQLEKSIAFLTHMAFAWAGALSACLVLLLGRWWQSLLYRPGAFQAEFHRLRMNWNQVVVIFLAVIVLMQGFNRLDIGNDLLAEGQLGMVIAPVFSIPLMLSGIALVHGLVAIAGVSAHWLGVFYMSLLFMGHLIYVPLIVTALLDVLVDFRARFKASRSDKPND